MACGYNCAPLSDRASTYAFVDWTKLAKKHELKPVYGVEIGVTTSLNTKKAPVDYWTFFAIDDLLPLHELIELATGQFYYEPLLSYKQALSAKGVLKIMGYRAQLDHVKKRKDLWCALAPSCSKGYISAVAAKGIPFIAASDNRYPAIGGLAYYEVICGRFANAQSFPQHILDKVEWEQAVQYVASTAQVKAAWKEFTSFGKRCNVELRKGQLLAPKRPATLLKMCQDGAKKLGIDLKEKVYAARLKRELDMIKLKNFEDYFYIIADMMKWARAHLLCGPARGSSCGSLVCYLLEITTVDPIPWGLVFERFIDITRSDLPDVDIDFSDQHRDKVFKYMTEKYGAERIARLGTVNYYAPRSALLEAGAALKVPKWKVDGVLDTLIERSSGDSRALQIIEDAFKDTPSGRDLISEFPEMSIAARMEGHPRFAGQHAAGIILTQQPVSHYVAIDRRTGATQCDKKDAEELNLLKIDALGLTQLSIFEDTLALAGLDRLHLEKVPHDDQAAFDVLNKGHFAGIFQFNGPALQSLSRQIRVNQIEDIVAITALGRPGPLASGGATSWVLRRIGEQPITYPHPAFEPYLSNSLGIVIYQEQVMEVGRHIGDLTWEDVTALRKAMSKSLGKEYFNQFGDRFKAGAIKKGIPPEVLDKVWDDLCAYGAWSFNRSHSVAYGIVSYWCCWLKAHFPSEFAAATLSHEVDSGKQIKMLREMAAEGIAYIPVDADISIDCWTIKNVKGKKTLVGPIQNVKGIGPKKVTQIMAARARKEKLPEPIRKLLANPKTEIDSIYPVRDAFDRSLPDPAAKNILTPQTTILEIQDNGKTDQEVVVFVVIKQIKPRDENEAVNVAKRGGKLIDGPSMTLNMRICDDTEEMLAKVARWDFPRLGQPIIDRGRPGKELYVMKGRLWAPGTFRMLMVKAVKYIGPFDGPVDAEPDEEIEAPKEAAE